MSELADIRSELMKISNSLGRVEANQLTQQGSIASLALASEKRDERLRAIEHKQSHETGRQSVISGMVSVVVAGVIAWAAKHFA